MNRQNPPKDLKKECLKSVISEINETIIMKLTSSNFSVTSFDVEGFLKLQKGEYHLQQNNIEFKTHWAVGVEEDLAYLRIEALYIPKKKLNFSPLATYSAIGEYIFINPNQEDKESALIKAIKYFINELENAYNVRLIGTRVKIPFPTTGPSQFDLIYQRTRDSLHKALERRSNLPPN